MANKSAARTHAPPRIKRTSSDTGNHAIISIDYKGTEITTIYSTKCLPIIVALAVAAQFSCARQQVCLPAADQRSTVQLRPTQQLVAKLARPQSFEQLNCRCSHSRSVRAKRALPTLKR